MRTSKDKNMELKSEKSIREYLKGLPDDTIIKYYLDVEFTPFPILVIEEYTRRFKKKTKDEIIKDLKYQTHLARKKTKEIGKMATKHKITILLKGPTDIISSGSSTYLYAKKIPAMTVGGTGDILSGLVAGMLSKNRNPLQSASAATFINGLAGKVVQKKLGLHMTSMDLLDVLPAVMKPFDRIE